MGGFPLAALLMVTFPMDGRRESLLDLRVVSFRFRFQRLALGLLLLAGAAPALKAETKLADNVTVHGSAVSR